MKILVIQLARLGDIYQSWPSLSALRRAYPGAQIDLLVRARFSEAAIGAPVDQILNFPSQEVLDLVLSDVDFDPAIAELSNFVEKLSARDYDKIINLSFSPSSSYLTKLISGPGTEVRGYTRHADGFLDLPEDGSAYFYAQVGVGRFNRYHVTDIFANVANVDLVAEDYKIDPEPRLSESDRESLSALSGTKPFIICHIGGSTPAKRYPAYKWRQALLKLEKEWTGFVYLVGDQSDLAAADEILLDSNLKRSYSLVGRLSLMGVASAVQASELLVCNDSVVQHLASLSDKKTLNLSFSSVNFWETGPLACGSRILWAEAPEFLPSDRVSHHILGLLNNFEADFPYIQVNQDLLKAEKYSLVGFDQKDYCWDFIKALYTGSDFPKLKESDVHQALGRLQQAIHLGLDHLSPSKSSRQLQIMGEILVQVDELFEMIAKIVPEVAPIVSWFKAEKIRIAPGDFEQIRMKTLEVFKNADLILAVAQGQTRIHPIHRSLDASPSLEG